jgi:hypothetical protein
MAKPAFIETEPGRNEIRVRNKGGSQTDQADVWSGEITARHGRAWHKGGDLSDKSQLSYYFEVKKFFSEIY